MAVKPRKQRGNKVPAPIYAPSHQSLQNHGIQQQDSMRGWGLGWLLTWGMTTLIVVGHGCHGGDHDDEPGLLPRMEKNQAQRMPAADGNVLSLPSADAELP